MPGAFDRAIRFRCPRCTTRLKAPPSRAGKRQRCPRCQFVLHVPLSSRVDKPIEEYQIHEGPDQPLGPPQTYIAVVCPLCNTRMVATLEQVGQEMACPDCGTRTVVPPPPPPAEKKAPPAAPIEEYALCDELEGAPAGSRAAEQKYIPVYCGLCNTLMQCTEDQVGQKIVCPDCGTSTVVPPPAPSTAKKTSADFRVGTDEEYAVFEGAGQPPPNSVAYQTHIPVVCFVCGTRMHATLDQVGREMICPDCGIPSVVPPPTEHRPPRYDLTGEEYEVGPGIKLPEYQAVGEYRWVGHAPGREAEGEEEREGALPPRRPPPIRRPFLQGVFTFPLYQSVWLRWVVMSVLTTALLFVPLSAIALVRVAPEDISGAGHFFVSMMLTALSGVLCLLLSPVTCVFCLAILYDTAAGNDEIENWPELSWFVDWIGECFYVVNSVLLSVAPGVATAWVVGPDSPAYWIAPPVSLLVLFPIVLLSMLEAGSPLIPVSAAVWSSFRSAWWAWGLFYLETTVAAGTLIGLAWAAVWFVGPFVLLAAPLLLVPALFIYFRLLGRLAWCCSRAARKAERAAAEASQDREEEQP